MYWKTIHVVLKVLKKPDKLIKNVQELGLVIHISVYIFLSLYKKVYWFLQSSLKIDVIDNCTEFEEKIARVLQAVCERIGLQIKGFDVGNRKRKFLVKTVPDATVRKKNLIFVFIALFINRINILSNFQSIKTLMLFIIIWCQAYLNYKRELESVDKRVSFKEN